MTAGICSPLIGASLTTISKPPAGVTPGAAGDATAPFALGTMVQVVGNTGKRLAQFIRYAATVANAGNTGVTNGVGVTAGAGNTWVNESGVQAILGDYGWVTSIEVLTP